MRRFNIQRITLDGPQNVRDLGGFTMMDGRQIPQGRLIRSCELYRLTENDQKILANEHNLKTIVDFRTGLEKEQVPDPEMDGVKSYWIPVLSEAMMGVTKEEGTDRDTVEQLAEQIKAGTTTAEQFMKKLYKDIVLNPHAANAYHEFFQVLLNQEEGASLWHCSAGKDRAGMATMLVLTALGASRELILEDYMMVNEFMKANIEYNRLRVVEKTGDEELANSMVGLFKVEKSYAEYAFQVMDEQFGSDMAYLEKMIGVTKQDCERLQQIYLV